MLPCSEHGHYHHGSQQSNYAHSQRQPPPNPIPRPRCSILDLGKLTSASLQPIREQRVPSLEHGIRCVVLGVSMGGIDEIPQGRPGTARLLLNPELPVSSTLSEHDKFLLRGGAAVVQPVPPALYSSRDLQKVAPYFRAASGVWKAVLWWHSLFSNNYLNADRKKQFCWIMTQHSGFRSLLLCYRSSPLGAQDRHATP